MRRLSGYLCTTALVIAASLLQSAPSRAGEASECRFTKVADLPVTETRDAIAVPVSINGKNTLMAIGTGAPITMFYKSKVAQTGIDLPIMRGNDVRRVPSHIQLARIDALAVGDWIIHGRMYVDDFDEIDLPGNVIGTLGEDYLQNVDFELDLKNKKIIIYQTVGCSENSPPLAPDSYSYVPLTVNGANHWPRILLDMQVNGHAVKMTLGTEYAHTRLSEQAAEAVGADLHGSQPIAAQFESDIGGGKLWMTRLDSVRIGDEEVRPAWLRTGGSGPEPVTGGYSWLLGMPDGYWQAVLGRDFLSNHHVVVSHSEHRFYYSYQGGEIFSRDGTQQAQAER